MPVMTPSRFRQLEAFRAVLQSGSVSRAAENLSLSQPAVTKLLRGLEDETGLTLFDRTHRRLMATPEAERLEAATGRFFAAADGLDRTVEEMRSVGSGELRVAAMPFFGLSLVPRLLARLAREEPPIRVSITVTSSRGVHDLVRTGEVDLGFAVPFAGPSALLAAAPVAVPGVLVLPRGHRLEARDTVELAELDGEPYVSLGRQYRLRDMVDELFERHGVAPRLVAETQSAVAACAMVAEGLGFAVADLFSARAVAAEVSVRTLAPTVTFSVDVLGPPGRPLSAVAGRFLRLLRDHPDLPDIP